MHSIDPGQHDISWPVRQSSQPTGAQATAQVSVPGSCGELVQGRLHDRDVLLSCPIERRVTARVELTESGRIIGLEQSPRAASVLGSLLRKQARPGTGARVWLDSPLPRGKGMASSTADISAVAGAALMGLGMHPSPSRVARLATRIEPADSIMYPGMVLMDRHTGHAIREFKRVPQLTLLALDPGGTVDTLAFHRHNPADTTVGDEGAFAAAVAAITDGLQSGDLKAIGTGATLSARLNQSRLPNPLLEPAERLLSDVGAYGLNVAHSGPLLALLMPSDPQRIDYARNRLRDRFGSRVAIETFTPIAGGLVTGGFSK